MCVKYFGAVSGDREMPGGGPQGTLLIVLLFILQVNHAGESCPALPSLPADVTGPEPRDPNYPALPCQFEGRTENKKFVDDLAMLEVVSLRELIPQGGLHWPLELP